MPSKSFVQHSIYHWYALKCYPGHLFILLPYTFFLIDVHGHSFLAVSHHSFIGVSIFNKFRHLINITRFLGVDRLISHFNDAHLQLVIWMRCKFRLAIGPVFVNLCRVKYVKIRLWFYEWFYCFWKVRCYRKVQQILFHEKFSSLVKYVPTCFNMSKGSNYLCSRWYPRFSLNYVFWYLAVVSAIINHSKLYFSYWLVNLELLEVAEAAGAGALATGTQHAARPATIYRRRPRSPDQHSFLRRPPQLASRRNSSALV